MWRPVKSMASLPCASVLIGLATALAGSPAAAADWNYRVRPGDNLWDLAGRYLKAEVPRQRLQDYNKVVDPYHLPPGMSLHVPVGWLRVEPAQASVVAVLGDAWASTADGAPRQKVDAGMRFGYGATLGTGAEASLTLQFADGSRVLLQGGSSLRLDKLSAYGRTGMVDTRLRLQHGRVANDVAPQNGAAAGFSVATPGSISSVRGTHFRVAADAGAQRSQTEVLSGHVDVAGGRRHVLLGGQQGVALADGAAPGAQRPLLDAPVLSCPNGPLRQRPYRLEWPRQQGALAYRVQLAPTARFEVLLLDQRVDPAAIELPDLADGDYALRVHAIDAQGLEGEDAACALHIDGHPQPPLVIAPQPDTSVAAARPLFRWTLSEEARSYAWQLATQADFSTPLATRESIDGDHQRAPDALPLGHYFWRVASRDANGKLGPYSAPLAFERVAEAPPPSPQARRQGDQLQLAWQAGAPGQRYQVQLARDAQFSKALLEQTVAQASLSMTKPGSGRWYARVRAVDSDGYAGAWGPTQRLKLGCLACRIAAAGGGAALLWLLL